MSAPGGQSSRHAAVSGSNASAGAGARRDGGRLPARITDWSLALAGGAAFASGLVSLVSGQPGEWPVFAFHGAAGLWLALLLLPKLRRVWPRLVRPRWWDWRTPLGALALGLVVLALASGIWWVAGGDLAFAGFGLLNWHIVLGFAVTAMIALHMLARAHWVRRRDLRRMRGRRQALQWSALALGAAVLWPAQQVAQRVLALPGARRRFTGSREASSYAGNAFPTSSWVADQPLPLATATWRLAVGGAVAAPLTLTYDEVAGATDELTATLDCTGGFYSTQRWRGVSVGRVLERARPLPGASYVRFVSVTGYRWSLPLDEARAALLAAWASGEPLAHEHGAPARLVAPGRRGFEWVKWLVRIEVLTAPDVGQVIAIHTSWLTPAGRGEPVTPGTP
ncbi:MAG TPA: molybdopterin-dependent oxidoreductase [Ktedonobacterales bacterium]